MKASGKERLLFDYMQEQANNLFDYCERNYIELNNIGFVIDPATGFAYISASVDEDENTRIFSRTKHHSEYGGNWDTWISETVYKREQE